MWQWDIRAVWCPPSRGTGSEQVSPWLMLKALQAWLMLLAELILLFPSSSCIIWGFVTWGWCQVLPQRGGQGQISDQLRYSMNGHCALPWDNSQWSGSVPPLRNKQIFFDFLLRVWLESSARDYSQVDLSPRCAVPMFGFVHVNVSSAGLPCKAILSCWEKEKPFLKKPQTT